MAEVRPITARAAPRPDIPEPAKPARPAPIALVAAARAPPPPPRRARDHATATLDASWDRNLGRGLVGPDRIVDLHGHTLATAYRLLDDALALAIAAGDRVILLVTGRPPRPDSERPHARGAIRAAVGDWLAASRHADTIAAVRGAHPRHGGAGALYIVLRRPRLRPNS
jgi:DNA-nicking Smr family endonuclease